MVDDVKRALEAGVEGIVMEVPSSRHIIEKAYRWEYQKAIDLTVEIYEVRPRERGCTSPSSRSIRRAPT